MMRNHVMSRWGHTHAIIFFSVILHSCGTHEKRVAIDLMDSKEVSCYSIDRLEMFTYMGNSDAIIEMDKFIFYHESKYDSVISFQNHGKIKFMCTYFYENDIDSLSKKSFGKTLCELRRNRMRPRDISETWHDLNCRVVLVAHSDSGVPSDTIWVDRSGLLFFHGTPYELSGLGEWINARLPKDFHHGRFLW